MESISKYVLEQAGKKYDQFILPESKCIRVEDLEVIVAKLIIPHRMFFLPSISPSQTPSLVNIFMDHPSALTVLVHRV